MAAEMKSLLHQIIERAGVGGGNDRRPVFAIRITGFSLRSRCCTSGFSSMGLLLGLYSAPPGFYFLPQMRPLCLLPGRTSPFLFSSCQSSCFRVNLASVAISEDRGACSGEHVFNKAEEQEEASAVRIRVPS